MFAHCDRDTPLIVQPLGNVIGYDVNVLEEQPALLAFVTDSDIAAFTSAVHPVDDRPSDTNDTMGAAGLQAGEGVILGEMLRLEVTDNVGEADGLKETVGVGEALAPQRATTLMLEVTTGCTPLVTEAVVAVSPIT
jgi:hypothetical protein